MTSHGRRRGRCAGRRSRPGYGVLSGLRRRRHRAALGRGRAGGTAAGDTLTGIEDLSVPHFADTLVGDFGDNRLFGGAGADALWGNSGDDTLIGGRAQTSLNGQAGLGHRKLRRLARPSSSVSGPATEPAATPRAILAPGSRRCAGPTMPTRWWAIRRQLLSRRETGPTRSGAMRATTRSTAGQGGDLLQGQDGADWASYATLGQRVTVRLWARAAAAACQGDTLGYRNLRGSDHADTLVGDAAERSCGGGRGRCALGQSGDDTLEGGAGADAAGRTGRVDWASYAASDTGSPCACGPETARAATRGRHAARDREPARQRPCRHACRATAATTGSIGGAGDDDIWANDGDDTLEGGAGSDILRGQGGSDTASYAGSAEGVTVRLWAGDGWGGDATGDVLIDIENAEGSAHDDVLSGSGGDNMLSGLGGRDEIWAGTATIRFWAATATTCCAVRAATTSCSAAPAPMSSSSPMARRGPDRGFRGWRQDRPARRHLASRLSTTCRTAPRRIPRGPAHRHRNGRNSDPGCQSLANLDLTDFLF
jgi:hypothetical protein